MLKFIKAILAGIEAANEMNKVVSQLLSNNRCHCPELRAELLQATKEYRASRMERMHNVCIHN